MARTLNEICDQGHDSIRPRCSKNSDITRRLAMGQLAAIGSSGLVTAVGLPSNLLAGASYSKSGGQHLTFEGWHELIGQSFLISNCHGDKTKLSLTIPLTLEEVNENSWIAKRDPNRPAGLRRAPLSLLFSSKLEITSATYVFDNATIGRSVFFVHPVPRDNRKHQKIYEVVLN